MTPEECQAALQTEPFQPVRVHLSDGRSHDILDPDTAHVGRATVVAGVYDSESSFPRWTLLSLIKLVSIAPLTAAQIG
jgi:hypothetical protein